MTRYFQHDKYFQKITFLLILSLHSNLAVLIDFTKNHYELRSNAFQAHSDTSITISMKYNVFNFFHKSFLQKIIFAKTKTEYSTLTENDLHDFSFSYVWRLGLKLYSFQRVYFRLSNFADL